MENGEGGRNKCVGKDDTVRHGWFESRLVERTSAIKCCCRNCGGDFWLPASKVARYKTCSRECDVQWRLNKKHARESHCKTCGNVFFPREFQLRSGVGRFCSQRCNYAANKNINSKSSKSKSGRTYHDRVISGEIEINRLKGSDSPLWKGGDEATYERRKESGKLGAYYSKNKDRYRAHTYTRRVRKNGRRLEYGAIKRTGDKQGWKCAYCEKNVKDNYHVDHVVPLSKGGENSELNIQILCPSCNLRKSAKNAIKFRQENGFLL